MEEIVTLKEEVENLSDKLDSFPNASEEFWETHDTLVQMLYKGIDLTNKEVLKALSSEFRNILDSLKNRIPSGYWK